MSPRSPAAGPRRPERLGMRVIDPAGTAGPAAIAAPAPARTVLTFVLCALVMMIDGYDLSAMPLAVPHVVKLWGVAPARFGIALSAVLAGLGLG
ncbi:MAG: hypothetical protein ACM3YM_12190, partial [Sphingomonadales bacterium]